MQRLKCVFISFIQSNDYAVFLLTILLPHSMAYMLNHVAQINNLALITATLCPFVQMHTHMSLLLCRRD